MAVMIDSSFSSIVHGTRSTKQSSRPACSKACTEALQNIFNIQAGQAHLLLHATRPDSLNIALQWPSEKDSYSLAVVDKDELKLPWLSCTLL